MSLIERNPIRPILIAWGHFALREEHHNLSFLIPIPSIVPPPAHIQIERMSNLVSFQILDKVLIGYLLRTSEHVQSVRTAKFSQLNEAISA